MNPNLLIYIFLKVIFIYNLSYVFQYLRWGEDGYIRLQRESSMECGTNSTPMDGTACVGGPGNDEQHVCGQCGVLFDVSYPLGAHSTM